MNRKNLLKSFLSSISYDKKLAKYDVKSCIVWTKTLAKKGIIKPKQSQKILKLLTILQKYPEKIVNEEDIHLAVETTLEKMLKRDKEIAGIIRTARSRNDLVVSDERLYIKEEMLNIISHVKQLVYSIVTIAEKNLDVIMVGNTHFQPAQPVLFSHYILCFAWWLLRDVDRLKDCYKRIDVSVLGSGAFAGTSFEIDRQQVAKELGFSKISDNSVDSVSDRDFIIEFVAHLAILSMHLSRIAEELIIWCHPAFGYISLPERLTSFSSIMPQKKNPDYLELIRAKTSRVYSDIIGILTLTKSLPLTYNRDLQEDKIYLFDAVEVVKEKVAVMDEIFKNMIVNQKSLKKQIDEFDYIFATEIANFMVKELKLIFKTAYNKTKQLIEYCMKKSKKIKEVDYTEYRKIFGEKFSKKCYEKLLEYLKVENLIRQYKNYGNTSPQQVKNQIFKIKNLIKKI
ncbi:MAG: argininosuccinate lyase [Endomicrobia bacterium]|nr:argininosuccinate lyase [Endomicrobiia bacterium]